MREIAKATLFDSARLETRMNNIKCGSTSSLAFLFSSARFMHFRTHFESFVYTDEIPEKATPTRERDDVAHHPPVDGYAIFEMRFALV